MRIAALLLTLLVTACAAPPPPSPHGTVAPLGTQSWPSFRGTPQLSGVANGQLPDDIARSWTFETGAAVLSSPTVAEGRVFVGSEDGVLHCLDLATGEGLWHQSFPDAVDAPPFLAGSHVVVGTLGGALLAFDQATGAEQWRYSTDGKIVGSANVVNLSDGQDLLVVGSYDSNVHAVDSADGRLHWTHQTSSYVNGTPAVFQSSVLFAGCDALLHRVSAADGLEISTVDVGSYAASSPAVVDGCAYLGTYGGEVLAINIEGAEILWRFEMENGGAPFVSSAAVNEHSVVIGDRDGRIIALDRATGTLRWSVTTGAEVDASPVIVGGSVLAASADGRLYGLSLADGSQRWRIEVGGAMLASPAVAANRIVVATEEGRVEAYEPRTE